jgi:hypothetical protein
MFPVNFIYRACTKKHVEWYKAYAQKACWIVGYMKVLLKCSWCKISSYTRTIAWVIDGIAVLMTSKLIVY